MPCGPLPASDLRWNGIEKAPEFSGALCIFARHIAYESGNKVNKSSGRGNMKRFTGAVGIDQGARVLFYDVRDGGAMWQGSGPREVRQLQEFEVPFLNPPAVTVGVAMWDIDHNVNSRVDIAAENITETGFEIVLRTWADSRIARIRASWMAIGAARDEEAWDVT